MSNSRLHKLKGKWNNGVIPLCDTLQRVFSRHNFDLGHVRAEKIKKREKIIDLEVRKEIESLNK